MKLLYRTAEWHGFAKLRMHTNSTLEHLEKLTKEFGILMRQFRDLSCSQFQTTELPREVAARNRRRHHAQAKQLFKPQPQVGSEMRALGDNSPAPTDALPIQSTSKSNAAAPPKTLNLFTPKFHALGDYVPTLRMFGGSDSSSTQIVRTLCLCARVSY